MNTLPFCDIVGLVDGAEHWEFLGAEPDHPGLDQVVVELVKRLLLVVGAMLRDESLDLFFEPIHLRQHVLWLEQGKAEVLTQPMRKLDLIAGARGPQVSSKPEPTLNLAEDILGEVEP